MGGYVGIKAINSKAESNFSAFYFFKLIIFNYKISKNSVR